MRDVKQVNVKIPQTRNVSWTKEKIFYELHIQVLYINENRAL